MNIKIEFVSKYTSLSRTNYALLVDKKEVDVSFVYSCTDEGGNFVIPTWLSKVEREAIRAFIKNRFFC